MPGVRPREEERVAPARQIASERAGPRPSGAARLQGDVIGWVATHRRHHAFTDRPGDPHSPYRYGTHPRGQLRGLPHAHVGRLFRNDRTPAARYAPDVLADRDIRSVSRAFPALRPPPLSRPVLRLAGSSLVTRWLAALFGAGGGEAMADGLRDAPGRRAREYGGNRRLSRFLVFTSHEQASAMPEFDMPHVTRLLPDAVHQAVKPGTAVVRLETRHDRQGMLDGAWWPRSRDIAAELPPLITALTGHLGPVTRVGLDAAAWDELPTRMTIDDRLVHIDSFPIGDDTVLITRGDRDLFSLLVVPPHTPPDAARAAMAEAVRADNVTRAEQILIDTGAGTGAG